MAAATTLKDFPQRGLELVSSRASYGLIAAIPEDSVRELRRYCEREPGKRLRLSGGDSPALHFGQKQIPLRFPRERAVHEVFASRDGKPELVARVKYRAVANTQDSAERELAERLAAIKEQKERLTTKTITDAELKSLKRDRNGRTYIRSPAMNPSKSGPLPSVSLTSGIKVNPRIQAIRLVLLHLLALRSDTLDNLCARVRCSRDDCKSVLDKVAILEKGQYELTRNSYKQLDIWTFRYPSSEDRETAVNNAITAFKRLRLPSDDPHWQNLLPEKERGKGKMPEPTVKPHPEEVEEAVQEDPDFREKQNAEHARRMAAKAKATKQILSGKKAPASPAPKAKAAKPAKPKTSESEGKFKSSEYVSESDDEKPEKAKPKAEKPRPAASASKLEKSPKRSPIGSPPHKRSPLGTSPPLNASDLGHERVPKAKSSAAQSAEYKSLKRKHDDDRVDDKKRHQSDDDRRKKPSVRKVDYRRIAELEESILLRNKWQQDYQIYHHLYEEVATAQRTGGHVDAKKYARVTRMQSELEEGKRRIAGMVGAC